MRFSMGQAGFRMGAAVLTAVAMTIIGCHAASTAGGGDPSAEALLYRLDKPADLPARLTIALNQFGAHIVVDVAINGQPAGPMLFDTGSNINGVEMGVVRRLHLPAAGKGEALGVGGHQAYTVRRIKTLILDHKLALPVHEMVGLNLLAFNRATDFNAAGIIGYRALGHVPFTIDASWPKLILYRPGTFTAPRHAERARLYHYRGLPLIAATLAGGHRVDLIIDTGADKALYLPSVCLKRWPDIVGVPITGPGQSTGIGGSVRGTQTWVRSLKMLNLELHNVPTVFEDAPAMRRNGRPIGRIGNRLLRHLRLTFSPDRRTLWSQWMPGNVRW